MQHLFSCRQLCVFVDLNNKHMQVLDLSSSVGSILPVPITACMATTVDTVDPSSCSVLVYDHNSTVHSLAADTSLNFKSLVDPSCTLARVYLGFCSACTAAFATAGKCPPGAHAFILDMGLPVGLENSTMLRMLFHVGSSLLSAEVMIQFNVISDSRGLAVAASTALKTLQSMLMASKV
jgi:hypothetical protein